MKKIITAFLFTFLSFQNFTGTAQIDTSFWFAVPFSSPDAGPRHDYKLHLYTYGNTTTIRVRQPALLMDTTFMVGPYSNFDYVFWFDKLTSTTNLAFDSLEAKPADVVLNYGLKISANHDISAVFDMVTTGNNPETFSLKGRHNGSGLEFYCPFQQKGNNQTLSNMPNTPTGVVQPKQQINIIATEYNTIVSITPKCNIIGHLANVTYTILLPTLGQVYTIENASQTTTVIANNLSGTHIVANKPISVTVADDCVKGLAGCYDIIGDQIVPVNKVGTDYVIVKGNINTTENEGVYVVGTNSNTTLTFDDGVVTTTVINAGDTYFYKTNQQLTSLNASSDVYVMHVTGVGCEMASDIVPPLACAGSTVAHFTRNNGQQLNLNIYCKNGAQNTFTLNGSTTLIPASAFTVVPGTASLPGGPYYGAKINFNTILIPIGSYTVSNNFDDFGLSICNGGATSGSYYHYMTEFLKKTKVAAAPSFSICQATSNNMAITFTGTVSGASSTGTWSTANGIGPFGTYSSTLNTITTTYTITGNDVNQTMIKFYLTSTGNCKAVKDSVIVHLTPSPVITFAPTNTNICNNDLSPISISATVTNATFGIWSSNGVGSFMTTFPNTIYNPNLSDLQNPPLILTLFATGMSSCPSSAMSLTFNVSPCTAINENNKEELFNIYPNPNTGEFTIISAIDMKLTLINELGEVVKDITLNNSNNRIISVTHLASGIYFITGKNNDQTIHQKIIVSK